MREIVRRRMHIPRLPSLLYGHDRLSSLPDNILHQILSFLDAKYAVQTCILSKRWRFLWISLPCLNFDSNHFDKFSSFAAFLPRVLSGHDDSTVCKLQYDNQLPHSILSDATLIHQVIDFAVSHQVQHLNITFNVFGKTLRMQPKFLACQSIKTLSLEDFPRLDLPHPFELPSMTALRLINCEFIRCKNESLDLVGRCVNLKSLKLTSCGFKGLNVLKISGQQLTDLSMLDCYCSINNGVGQFEVFAPKLQSFSFRDYYTTKFSAIDLPSLENVYLDVRPVCYENYSVPLSKFGDLVNMLQGLGNAQSVTLTLGIMKVFNWGAEELERQPSPFRRLKSLILEAKRKGKFRVPGNVMKYLLSGSNCVKNITFQNPHQTKCYN